MGTLVGTLDANNESGFHWSLLAFFLQGGKSNQSNQNNQCNHCNQGNSINGFSLLESHSPATAEAGRDMVQVVVSKYVHMYRLIYYNVIYQILKTLNFFLICPEVCRQPRGQQLLQRWYPPLVQWRDW